MNKQISVNELNKLMEQGLGDSTILIDVRSTFEYNMKSIEGSVNYPLDEIETKKEELAKYDTVYLLCRSGARSQAACFALFNMGLDNPVNITGGILAWQREGFPTD